MKALKGSASGRCADGFSTRSTQTFHPACIRIHCAGLAAIAASLGEGDMVPSCEDTFRFAARRDLQRPGPPATLREPACNPRALTEFHQALQAGDGVAARDVGADKCFLADPPRRRLVAAREDPPGVLRILARQLVSSLAPRASARQGEFNVAAGDALFDYPDPLGRGLGASHEAAPPAVPRSSAWRMPA